MTTTPGVDAPPSLAVSEADINVDATFGARPRGVVDAYGDIDHGPGADRKD